MNTNTQKILCLASFAALLATPLDTQAAAATGAFQASITITSSCATRQSFFGVPIPNENTIVTCQPSMTPFVMQSINLNGMQANATSASGTGNKSTQGTGSEGGAADGKSALRETGIPFSVLSSQDVLAIPLPGQSTAAARLIYVKF
ncbi:MAG: hypothetical protein EPN41_15190 [Candidimonas sp.]|nr:MAG: hypothetical protein EPN41_15190 [Candidimonas sp.]